jgi:hypothetical protein
MSNTPTSRGDDRISTVLVWWLLAVSGSVLIGFLLLAFAPAVSGATWGVGIVLNVSMPVAVGVFFGWTHQGLQVLIAVVLGAVVTILGLDLLVLTPSPAENSHFGLLAYAAFDSVGVLIALFGMAILIGGGALAGAISHLVLSRSGCIVHIRSNRKRRRPTLPFTSFRLAKFASHRSGDRGRQHVVNVPVNERETPFVLANFDSKRLKPLRFSTFQR